MFENLRTDIERARSEGGSRSSSNGNGGHRRTSTLTALFRFTTWPVISYRFSHSATNVHVPVLRELLVAAAILFERWIQLWTKVYIHREARIGPGLLIRTPYAVLIGIAEIGRNCTVESGTLISGRIGDNVYFGSGAKVIGDVHIGNHVTVTANSLVLADIKDGVTVGGVPARKRLLQSFLASVAASEVTEKLSGETRRL